MSQKRKIIVILGPTATGKSDLAVWLAKKFSGLPRGSSRGEVISADSRQVYKGMDIGTGKITKKEMADVPHHLLDVASPKRVFTVARYKKLAEKTIEKILERRGLPIICGGTGFYIQSIVDGLVIPDAPPKPQLRKRLARKSVEELFGYLKKLDPRRAKNIDNKNRVRLVRAIEIAKILGAVPKFKLQKNEKYEFLQIGLTLEKKSLKTKVQNRLLKRFKSGMVAEVRKLKRSGVSWKRLEEFGLEYRFIARYLRGELNKKEMAEKLTTAITQYAKRQMTWFKRDKRIHWVDPKSKREVEKLAADFLYDKIQPPNT